MKIRYRRHRSLAQLTSSFVARWVLTAIWAEKWQPRILALYFRIMLSLHRSCPATPIRGRVIISDSTILLNKLLSNNSRGKARLLPSSSHSNHSTFSQEGLWVIKIPRELHPLSKVRCPWWTKWVACSTMIIWISTQILSISHRLLIPFPQQAGKECLEALWARWLLLTASREWWRARESRGWNILALSTVTAALTINPLQRWMSNKLSLPLQPLIKADYRQLSSTESSSQLRSLWSAASTRGFFSWPHRSRIRLQTE